MAISFKDTLGTVGIDWDSLQEGNDYQRMTDADALAQNPLVVSGDLGANRNLRLTYPPNVASQTAFAGVTVVVINSSGTGNDVVVERQTGGASTVNVTPGQTAYFMLNGGSLVYDTIYQA